MRRRWPGRFFRWGPRLAGVSRPFCGKSVAPDKPYCPEHCDRAYNTTVKKRKSA